MSSDLARRIHAVRRVVRLRERTKIVSSIAYECGSCGMRLQVQVASGVSAPDSQVDGAIPAPVEIACGFCDGRAHYATGSREESISGLLLSLPYLRVPSRRALARMAAEDRFEAQLVVPEASTWL